MPLIINQQPVNDDRWISINDVEQLQAQAGDADLIVSWALFQEQEQDKEQSQEQEQALAARSGQLGLAIPNDLDVNELVSLLPQLALIAVDFPSFGDGRAFSQAQLLRRAGFSGQIRALGDVTWDRLRFMHRCGIDAMEIDDARYTPEMLHAFAEVTVRNQGAADDPRPLYRQQEA
ncbi:MAG: hypothetical protein ACJAWL_003096 [Motiliproteus sp.]|jgi:uncharacterized protein (DUF934 family)